MGSIPVGDSDFSFIVTAMKKGLILHLYIPIMATSLQQPLVPVLKVAVMERVTCEYSRLSFAPATTCETQRETSAIRN